MLKYILLWATFLIAACSNRVDVEHRAEYKCGEQIIETTLLDDDSLIVKINGVDNVLSRAASSSGRRYENIRAQITLERRNGDVFLIIKGRNYPLCQQIDR